MISPLLTIRLRDVVIARVAGLHPQHVGHLLDLAAEYSAHRRTGGQGGPADTASIRSLLTAEAGDDVHARLDSPSWVASELVSAICAAMDGAA